MLTEFAPRQGDFAVVAAAVSVDIADGVCRSGRVVLGGVGPLPVEVNADQVSGQPRHRSDLAGYGRARRRPDRPPAHLPSPFADAHGDTGFRRRLTATLVSRALAEASQLEDEGQP